MCALGPTGIHCLSASCFSFFASSSRRWTSFAIHRPLPFLHSACLFLALPLRIACLLVLLLCPLSCSPRPFLPTRSDRLVVTFLTHSASHTGSESTTSKRRRSEPLSKPCKRVCKRSPRAISASQHDRSPQSSTVICLTNTQLGSAFERYRNRLTTLASRRACTDIVSARGAALVPGTAHFAHCFERVGVAHGAAH